MNMIPLTSSNIHSAGYDPTTQTLRISFKSGGTYDYADVSEEQAKSFLESKSPGRHFHLNIRGEFNSQKVME